jgi:CMP-N-acetylneuraminic acid synthetase
MNLGGKKLFNYALSAISLVEGVDEIIVYASEDFVKPHVAAGINYRFVRRGKHLDEDVNFNDVMSEAIHELNSDHILYFCVTSPFIRTSTVEDMINKVKNESYDSSFTAKPMRSFCWFKNKPLNYDPTGDIPFTQDLQPVLVETSGLYIFERELFLKKGRRIGDDPYIKEVDEIEGHDIDYPEDFAIAEAIVSSSNFL